MVYKDWLGLRNVWMGWIIVSLCRYLPGLRYSGFNYTTKPWPGSDTIRYLVLHLTFSNKNFNNPDGKSTKKIYSSMNNLYGENTEDDRILLK